MTPASAIRLAKRLEPYDPMWFEEPVPPGQSEAMSRVAQHTNIPIATGERLTRKYEFHDLLKNGAAAILQMNLGRVGGILEGKKIASIAEAYYVQVAPHLYNGPVGAAASIQLATATPNFLIQESIGSWGDFHADVLQEKIEWKAGYIIPSDKPGLGIELNMEVVKAHSPYMGKALHLSMDSRPYDYRKQSDDSWWEAPERLQFVPGGGSEPLRRRRRGTAERRRLTKMDETELAFAGIARQAELLRAREISSIELVELYLARIERINPKLNAFTEVFGDEARAAAADADRRLATGTPESNATQAPLLGVPIALKDEIDVKGLIAQHGTCAYSEPASADATLWHRLREAGAILLGKTTLPELAICGFTESETWGATRNPWNTAYTPGGSSGGSGAAVAAGLVGAASASDGAGSIRIPAACNGLFGLKPQRDRISLAPHRGNWLGLSVSGCLTRRVRDTALWIDIAHGPKAGDLDSPPPPAGTYSEAAARDPGELRIFWSLSTPRAVMPPLRDPAIEAAVKRVAVALGRLGHRVSERDPDWGLISYDCVNVYLKGIETDYDQVPHPERLESRTRGFKRLARLIPSPLLRRSQAREQGHAERINAIFEHCDVLLSPVTAMPQVKVGHWAEQGALRTVIGMSRVYPHTIVWNYLGQPAASIPAGSTPEGLPLAVQLVVPPNREDLLISLAAQLEDELGWAERRPPLAV